MDVFTLDNPGKSVVIRAHAGREFMLARAWSDVAGRSFECIEECFDEYGDPYTDYGIGVYEECLYVPADKAGLIKQELARTRTRYTTVMFDSLRQTYVGFRSFHYFYENPQASMMRLVSKNNPEVMDFGQFFSGEFIDFLRQHFDISNFPLSKREVSAADMVPPERPCVISDGVFAGIGALWDVAYGVEGYQGLSVEETVAVACVRWDEDTVRACVDQCSRDSVWVMLARMWVGCADPAGLPEMEQQVVSDVTVCGDVDRYLAMLVLYRVLYEQKKGYRIPTGLVEALVRQADPVGLWAVDLLQNWWPSNQPSSWGRYWCAEAVAQGIDDGQITDPGLVVLGQTAVVTYHFSTGGGWAHNIDRIPRVLEVCQQHRWYQECTMAVFYMLFVIADTNIKVYRDRVFDALVVFFTQWREWIGQVAFYLHDNDCDPEDIWSYWGHVTRLVDEELS